MLSIVIPTCGHLEDCLNPCIESFKEHIAYREDEVIVVANGCKDDTKKYVESLGKQYKLLWFENQIGAPRAYNEGIISAVGDHILLLNDDVKMLDNTWTVRLLSPFIDSKVGLTGIIKFTLPVGSKEREALAFWCVMIKRAVFDKIGYLDEIFYPFGCEDIDFCIRAADAGYKLVQVPEDTSNKFLKEKPKGELFPIYHKGSVTVDKWFNDAKKKQFLENRNLKIIYDRYGA